MLTRIAGRVRDHKVLVLILVLFWGAGLAYDSALPLFEGLDELWHYAMVKRLADGGGLVVVEPGVDSPWRQEGVQPPLYYALMALGTFWIDTSDYWAHRMLASDELTIGDPFAEGDKFFFYHTRSEDFPYRRTTLAVHLARWLSALMGAGAVVLAYATAGELLPGRRAVAWLTTALVAFNPEFVFVSAQVNNDNLANLLGAAIGYLLARLWRRGYSTRLALSLGLAAGLIAVTKVSGLVVLGAIALVAALVARRDRAWRQFVGLGVSCVAGVALLAGWWYLRNLHLYGELLATRTLSSFVGFRDLTLWETLAEHNAMHLSYWGVLGLVNMLLPGWFYDVYRWLGLAGAGGLAVLLWRERRLGWNPLWVAVIVGALSVSGAVYWTSRTAGPIGRLAFTGIGANSLLLASGLLALVPRRWDRPIAFGLTAGLAALALAVPSTTLRPGFAPALRRPPLASAGIVAQVRQETMLADLVALRGYDLALSASALEVTLHWEVLARTDWRLIAFVHLLDENGTGVAGHDGVTVEGAYPSELWSPGEWLVDRHVVALPDGLPEGRYRLVAGMYRFPELARLPAVDDLGQRLPDDLIPLQAIAWPQPGQNTE